MTENRSLFQDKLNRRSPSCRLTMGIGSFWTTASLLDTRRIYHVASSAKCNIPLWKKKLKTELLGLFHLNNHSIILIDLIMILNYLIFTTWDSCINFTPCTTLRDEEESVCIQIQRLCFCTTASIFTLCNTLKNTHKFVETCNHN
jgi:hypothetical protein